MSDLARLRVAAKRRYERGRALLSLRVALFLVPLTVWCAYATGTPVRSGAVGFTLLIVAIFVRWRQPNGVRSTEIGLRTGVIPMAAALVLCRFAESWPAGAALSVCCAAGFVAGALAARAPAVVADAARRGWMTRSLVAGLTAALGCVGIGIGAALGGIAAVALGAIVAIRLPQRAAA